MAYMSYRHGRHDLQLPPPDQAWSPVADGDPDDGSDLAETAEDVGAADVSPSRIAGGSRSARSSRSSRSSRPSLDGPGELVEGATARLRAVLEAFPELPVDLT